MKRYFMEYESDRTVCKTNRHTWGAASSLRTAKQYITKCRKALANENPRNFRIYDTYTESNECAKCVYMED